MGLACACRLTVAAFVPAGQQRRILAFRRVFDLISEVSPMSRPMSRSNCGAKATVDRDALARMRVIFVDGVALVLRVFFPSGDSCDVC
jgi:hypothetical protein